MFSQKLHFGIVRILFRFVLAIVMNLPNLSIFNGTVFKEQINYQVYK